MLNMKGLPTKEIAIEVIDFDKLTEEQVEAIHSKLIVDMAKEFSGDTAELESATPIDFAREMYHRYTAAAIQNKESEPCTK